MHILYLSQYFPPETGATQNRALAMASGLVRHGHTVTVLCEVPNHPQGVIRPGYRGRRRVRRRADGLDIRHLWVFTRARKGFGARMLFYVSYMLHAIWEGLWVRRVDIIYASSPPLFVAAAGAVLARIRRRRFVMEVRDLWPEAAVQLGELRSPRARRWAERLEAACYATAARVVVVTAGAQRSLEERLGARRDILRLIPNGADEALCTVQRAPATRPPELRERFVVLYAGLMGLAQDLDTVLDAACLLRSRKVHFLLVGDGPASARLRERVAAERIENVTCRPAVDPSELPALYGQADAAVIPLRRLPLFRETVPSKLFDCMAAGLPILLGVDGEARAILGAADAGLFVEPGQSEALAHAIEGLLQDPAQARAMGERGRVFVRRGYTREAQAGTLVRELEALTGGHCPEVLGT